MRRRLDAPDRADDHDDVAGRLEGCEERRGDGAGRRLGPAEQPAPRTGEGLRFRGRRAGRSCSSGSGTSSSSGSIGASAAGVDMRKVVLTETVPRRARRSSGRPAEFSTVVPRGTLVRAVFPLVAGAAVLPRRARATSSAPETATAERERGEELVAVVDAPARPNPRAAPGRSPRPHPGRRRSRRRRRSRSSRGRRGRSRRSTCR